MNKRIYIFRHGETDYNKNKMMQGRSIDAELNKTGLEQVKRFFEYHKHIPFEVIFSSDLKRSIQSIERFKELDIPHIVDERITEFSWGISEGKVLNKELIDCFHKMVEEWKNGNIDYAIPGGESARSLKERIDSFISHIQQRNEKFLLINTHGRALRMLVTRILNEPIESMEKYEHNNTGLYVFDFDGNEFKMKISNDIAHLN